MKTWTSLLHSAKQNGRTIRSEIGTLRAFENNDCTFGARVRIVHLVDVPFLTLSTWLTYLFVFARLVWYMPFPTIFIRMMYFSWRWPSVLRTVTDAAHLVDVPSVFAHVVWQIKHFRRCQSGWCTFPDAGHLADVPFLTLPIWLTYLFWCCPSSWRTYSGSAHLANVPILTLPIWLMYLFWRCPSGWRTFSDAAHLADVPFLTLPIWLTYLF